jgi:hypothetical protein
VHEHFGRLCHGHDELGIAPTLFYRWQKELFENGRIAKAVEEGRKLTP